jgi:Flp pilus assembly protein TadG
MPSLLRRARGEAGTTILEFALGSALLFTMIFGIIEFGWAVWQYNMVSDLAQEGARYAAVHGSQGTSPTPALASDIQTYVQGRASGIPVTVSTTWSNTSKTAGSTVTVQVSLPHTRFTTLVTAGVMTLSSTASMIIAR